LKVKRSVLLAMAQLHNDAGAYIQQKETKEANETQSAPFWPALLSLLPSVQI
jgi:hypothetical protein